MIDRINVYQLLAENKSGFPLKVRRDRWSPNSFFLITGHEEMTGDPPYFNNPKVYGHFCHVSIDPKSNLSVAGSYNWEIWKDPDFSKILRNQ